MAQMQVEVVAVEERLYSGAATLIVSQTTEGQIGVMAGHEPLLAEIPQGGFVLIKEEDGTRRAAAVYGGFLSVTGGHVTVLAESADWADTVDVAVEREVLASEEEGSVAYRRAQSRLRAVEQVQS